MGKITLFISIYHKMGKEKSRIGKEKSRMELTNETAHAIICSKENYMEGFIKT